MHRLTRRNVDNRLADQEIRDGAADLTRAPIRTPRPAPTRYPRRHVAGTRISH